MQTGEPSGARGAPRAEEQEPVYEGKPGQTRLRPIHIPLSSGFVRTLSVYDVVNVGTDPNLKEAALGGALHRFETGEELAVPFVYHDPKARKLVLVVPPVLRHEELRLRSELLKELAEHTASPIPSYVRDADTVVGHKALGEYLSAPDRRAADEQKEQDLEIRSDALEQREARLHKRAEEVTRREDELRTNAEELEAGRADLAMQERELETRFERLAQREAALSESVDSVQTVRADEVVQLDGEAMDAIEDLGAIEDLEAIEAIEDLEDMENVEEIEELEPLKTSPGQLSGDLSDEVELVDDELIDPIEDVEELDDSLVEAVEDDEIEELEEIEPLDTGVNLRPMVGQDTVVRSEPEPAEPGGPIPSEMPPPGFLAPHGPEAQAVTETGGVRIFAKLPEGRDDLFEGAPPEILAQLVVVEERPVVLLSLVEVTDGRPTVVRAALDPRDDEDREVIENLARNFAARVALFRSDGRYIRSVEAASRREKNAARILDRVAKMRTAAAVDIATAVERVLSSPPPIRDDKHPFADASKEPKNAAEALALLGRVADWSGHEKMDHALLVLSVPRGQVDATIRAAIDGAISHGLPLPGYLPDRAVALGLASDVSSLVAAQIARFKETSTKLGRGGLSREQVAESWESLLEAATNNEVAIDADTHETAWKAIREVRGGDDALASIDTSKLPEMGAPELLLLLDHPRYRREAAIELAGRGDPEFADALCQAARKMPRSEVVRVVPKILALGDGAGDALIDGLSARKTFVRQAFALSLGQLKLRRAVVPLVHLLASEESEVWREIARVIGSFGTASLRNVKRQLKDPKGKEQRYILALAHLANNGCLKQVEKLTQDDKPKIATMAREALALRDEAKRVEDRIASSDSDGNGDPVLAFSQRFRGELDGTAPDADLV